MKIIALIPLLLWLTACQRPQRYTIAIQEDSLDVFSGRILPHEKISYIMAYTDSQAYEKGLCAYYGCLAAEDLFKKKGISMYTVVKSFEVKDTAEMNVEFKLPQQTVTELNKAIEGVYKKTKL